jgi:uncharacterized protein (TIGR02271 family)
MKRKEEILMDKDRTGNTDRTTGRDSNPDPLTGAPGSHPVATGVGAAAAGAAGAAIGSVVPGIGTAIGGAVGAIVGAVGGGYAGKAVGEAVDPTGTDDYWRENYKTRHYVKSDADYNRYRPAYQCGARLADRSNSATFDEKAARAEWDSNPDRGNLDFDSARDAMRDEFTRRIQLREEQLRVNKERVSGGDVNIRKEVTTERKTVDVPVEREEVVVTHRPAPGTARDNSPIKEQEIRIPVSEERVNVSKETVVTGEVEVAKRKVTDTQKVSDDVRKENVRVEKTGTARVDDRTKNP